MENNNNNEGGNHGTGNGQNPKRQNWLMLFLAATIIVLGIAGIVNMLRSGNDNQISYDKFIEMVDNEEVSKVVIGSDKIYIYPIAEEETTPSVFFGTTQKIYYTGLIEDATLTAHLLRKGVEVSGEIPDNSGQIWYFLFSYVLPIGLMCFLGFVLIRKISKSGGMGGVMGVGKSNAKVYVQKETGITFKDVAGEDEAIESLQEVVDFLHNPDRYVKIGARLPKGALLVGPPGTGKTLLAKAVAGEAKVPFFSLTGSDFVELYVGVGASRVRDLFREAEKNAPCIIFIDEIDAIGRSRDSKYGGGNEEREQTLNQLLSEMDGFDGEKGVIILAATNRPEVLDKALLRPGRFDRRIIVEKPDLKGRVEILKVHAKDVKMDETVDFNEIALATSGAVGSDLANMINEAAINAVKQGRELVCQKDLFNAVEIVIVGKEKKDRILSEEERKIVSYHEVGHALVSALQKNSEPVQKITIVPRTMGALGFVMHVPEEEKYLKSEVEMREMLVGLLAGRAAEEIVFGAVTTGPSNDIERATEIARSMITRCGMSKKFGPVALENVESQYLDGRAVMNCADVTAAAVDEEVMALLKQCYKEAVKMLKANRKVMDKLAAYLIKKETITGQEFMKIYCKEKGIPVPKSKTDTMREKFEKTQNAEVEEREGKSKKSSKKKKTIDITVDDDTELSNETEEFETEVPSVEEGELENEEPENEVSDNKEDEWKETDQVSDSKDVNEEDGMEEDTDRLPDNSESKGAEEEPEFETESEKEDSDESENTLSEAEDDSTKPDAAKDEVSGTAEKKSSQDDFAKALNDRIYKD